MTLNRDSTGQDAVEQNTEATVTERGWASKTLGGVTEFGKKYPVWIFVLVIFVFFSFMNPFFFTAANLTNILLQTSFIGFIAIGMTFVMINRQIDLSVGSVLTLSAVLAIGLQPYGLVLAIAAGLLAGTLIGLFNGLIVVKTGVNAFIVTLGGLIGVRGLVFLYTRENSVIAENPAFALFGSSAIGPLPTIAAIFLVLVFAGHWVLQKTAHGRNVYAVGGNYDAAVNAGISVKRHIVINFVLVGFLAAFAGLMLSTQLGAATPTLGLNYELWTITAVVLGGVKLEGGYGSILGAFGGVLAIGILRNGMNLMQVQPYYVLVTLGLILIAVLFIDKQFGKR